MYKVPYVPQPTRNLFSVRVTASTGNFIGFGHSCCWIRGSDGKLNGMGTLIDNCINLIVKPLPLSRLQLLCHR